ncbi:MAG: histidine kinase dimerization/phospho-acceptor domain-containing protein [Actinomycetes bacterium]
MRRRVLQATVASVVLAVLLLGVPLAIAGAALVRDSALRSAQDRSDALARSIERRVEFDQEVSEDALAPYVNAERDWTAHVVVEMPDGRTLTAGVENPPYYVGSTTSTEGLSVRIEVPRSAVVADAASVVALVLVVGAVAVAAGWGLGLVQARRLAAPLVELAESAVQLGSGQIRPAPQPSGVEEVDLVAQEIARSAERMAARLAAEREFASDASHQLRTPLTAVSMRLEEIMSSAEDDAVREEARIALDQVERLVQVVDDLLARTRSGRPVVGPLALSEVLRQQQEEWLPQFDAAGRRLDVEVPEDVVVLATPGPLAQTVATLLENSLIHGGGTTSVRTRTSGTSVVLEIADEGDGIPDALGTRVFERKVSSARSTGLGLALARDLVTADGGRLELLRSRPPVFGVFLRAA